MRTYPVWPAAGLTLATLAGLINLALAGAGAAALIVNLAALVFALGLFAVGSRLAVRAAGTDWPGWVLIAAGIGALFATALWGVEIDGVRRWVAFGPVTLHTGMLVGPALMVLVARAKDWRRATAEMIAIAAAIAIQPDRGVAIAMVSSALAMLLVRRRPGDLALLLAAAGALAVTLLAPDSLPPVQFTEHVLQDAWRNSPAFGLIPVLGLVSLFLSLRGATDRSERDGIVLCLAFFAGLIIASLIGSYPTPIVGAGASPILGFGLGIAVAASQRQRRSTPVHA